MSAYPLSTLCLGASCFARRWGVVKPLCVKNMRAPRHRRGGRKLGSNFVIFHLLPLVNPLDRSRDFDRFEVLPLPRKNPVNMRKKLHADFEIFCKTYVIRMAKYWAVSKNTRRSRICWWILLHTLRGRSRGGSRRLRPDPRIRVRQFGRDISVEGQYAASRTWQNVTFGGYWTFSKVWPSVARAILNGDPCDFAPLYNPLLSIDWQNYVWMSRKEKIGFKLFCFPPPPLKFPRQIVRFWEIPKSEGDPAETL